MRYQKTSFAYFAKVEPVKEKEFGSIFDKVGRTVKNWGENWEESRNRARAEAKMVSEVIADLEKAGIKPTFSEIDKAFKARKWNDKTIYSRDLDRYYKKYKKSQQKR